jgi:DNA-binding transcriptional MocR family regulator
VLVTAGALQATWLTVTTLVGGGDLVLVEEPTYRGALEVMRELGAQIQGIPLTDGGVSPDHVDGAAGRHPKLLYCQTGIHNPTGQSMNPKARRQLAGVINNHRLLTIEDRCSADLTLAGPEVTPGLASMVDPDLILTIGTASKLFWGGIRVGWIRASEDRIRALGELLKSVQLACSVQDQLATVEMLRRTTEARAERRATLSQALNLAEAELGSAFPDWTWEPIRGGSGIWVDTGQDALALAERGKRHGVKLNAGPSFSPHGGQRTMIRLPVWHDAPLLRRALDLLQPRSH